MSYRDKDRQRAYGRAWIRSRREAWLRANGPCRQCGSSDRLEVDHIDPAQKVHHAVWSWTEARRAVELAKCQVLCCMCHRAKTGAQFRKPLVHGTANGYRKHDCRCELCRAWNRARTAVIRARKRARTLTAHAA